MLKCTGAAFHLALGALAKQPQKSPAHSNLDSEYMRLLDRGVGFERRQLAVAKRLQRWYEIDPDSDDAKQLTRELCGDGQAAVYNLNELDAFMEAHSKQLDTQPVLVRAKQQDRLDQFMNLEKESQSAIRELQGMGFGCK